MNSCKAHDVGCTFQSASKDDSEAHGHKCPYVQLHQHLSRLQGEIAQLNQNIKNLEGQHDDDDKKPIQPVPSQKINQDQWWRHKKDKLLELASKKTPIYVYDEETIQQRISNLLSLHNVTKFFYAIKANPHPHLLKLIHNAGCGFECVSPGEVDHIFSLFPSIDPQRILFTPNFAPKEEYEFGFQKKVLVNVDSIYPLLHWHDTFKNQKISLRLDPGKGEGHHKHVKTAGNKSKFGISDEDIVSASLLSKEHSFTVVGLHAHLGSGILTPEAWSHTAQFLSETQSKYFPHVKFIDLGGGLGVPYKEDQQPLDLKQVDASLKMIKDHFPHIELWLEPGRYFVAECGVVLAKVTQTKNKGGEQYYVGINTGFNTLIRPMLYNSYHQIANLSRLNEPVSILADVVGNICESGDVFGHNRWLPDCKEGDVLLLSTTGAYGHSMSSHYNLRNPAEEIVLRS